MAKFWAKIRQVIHNVPIPGVGISINQAKDVVQQIKGDPGGEVVYYPPAGSQQQTAGTSGNLISGIRVAQTDYAILIVLVVIAAWLIFRK